jgi:uncharacterized protein (DUF885 family)
MRRLLVVLLSSVVLCAAGILSAQDSTASRQLRDLIAFDEETSARLMPEQAALRGEHRHSDTWNDYSERGRNTWFAHAREVLSRLAHINVAQLSEQDALTVRLLRRTYEFELEGARFPEHYLPLDHFRGAHLRTPRVLTAMPRATAADYEAILARLAALPDVLAQWRALLDEGLQRDVTFPRAAIGELPGQIIGQVGTGDAFSAPLMEAFRILPETIPPDTQARVRERAQVLFTSRVKPAYEHLHEFLVNTYLPNARRTNGWSDLPDGRAWYAYEIRRHTMSNRTPEEIHSTGMKRIESLTRALRELGEEVGVTGGIAELRAFMERQGGRPSLDEILREYRDIAKRVDPLLPRYFKTLPRAPFGIEATPTFRGRTTAAYYEPPARDGSRAGMFFIPRLPEDTSTWRIMQTALHEGMPGHHLQLALTMEMRGIPDFRLRGMTAFVEGWASYADRVVGEQMGLYSTPAHRFGLLMDQMISAVGYANDTGLHALGWTREQLIDLRSRSMAGPNDAHVISTNRHSVYPGQILSYSAGADVIAALREEMAASLGHRFDVREFHEVVLRDGPLPLDVLQERVRAHFRQQ